MNSETKGVLGITFGILAFSNPVSELFLVLYDLLLKNWLMLQQKAIVVDYVVIKVIFSIAFIIASIYFSQKARKEKSKRLGNAGIILAVLSLIYLIWYVYGMLKLGGYIQ